LLRLDYGESLYSFRSSEKLHASTAITPPPGLIDAVRRGDFIDDRCEFRCSLEEARALRDWLLARAEMMRSTNAVTAAVLAQPAADVAEAIAST